jgi:hypothetical protein
MLKASLDDSIAQVPPAGLDADPRGHAAETATVSSLMELDW